MNYLYILRNNRTNPHQADSGQFWESLDRFYWYRLAVDDLSMANSEHRKNGNCTYNFTRYRERFKYLSAADIMMILQQYATQIWSMEL